MTEEERDTGSAETRADDEGAGASDHVSDEAPALDAGSASDRDAQTSNGDSGTGLREAGASVPAADASLRFAYSDLAGSSIDVELKKWAATVASATMNAIKVQAYTGGVAGNEADYIRKMRAQQLDGAILSRTGLRELAPSSAILMTGLIQSEADLQRVRTGLAPMIESELRSAGFVRLGWFDVGGVRILSQARVETPTDFSATRPWLPRGDALAKAFYEAIGASFVELDLPEVLPALQTKMIDACFTTAANGLGLQWFRYAKFVTVPMHPAQVGAVVVRTGFLDGLSEAQRKALHDTFTPTEKALADIVRDEDEKAAATMIGRGVQETAFGPSALDAWRKVNEDFVQAQTGRLWSAELVATVRVLIGGN